MKMTDLEFEKIESYAPYNDRANRLGMITQWRCTYKGTTIAIGNTKKECMQEARVHILYSRK